MLGFSLLPVCVCNAGSICAAFGVAQSDSCKPGVAFGASPGREGRDTAGTAALVPNPLLFPPERREGWMHQPCRALLPTGEPLSPPFPETPNPKAFPTLVQALDPFWSCFSNQSASPCSPGLAQDALTLLFPVSKCQNSSGLSVGCDHVLRTCWAPGTAAGQGPGAST